MAKVAINGMGRIGRAVAERARSFGMIIHYSNRNRLPADLEQGALYHADADERNFADVGVRDDFFGFESGRHPFGDFDSFLLVGALNGKGHVGLALGRQHSCR